jgi:hypothetical protein
MAFSRSASPGGVFEAGRLLQSSRDPFSQISLIESVGDPFSQRAESWNRQRQVVGQGLDLRPEAFVQIAACDVGNGERLCHDSGRDQAG